VKNVILITLKGRINRTRRRHDFVSNSRSIY